MVTTATPQPAAERRGTNRRQPTLGTVCRLDGEPKLGLVWNISPGGVSMLVNRRLEPGTTLRGELTTGDEKVNLPVTVRVSHAAKLRTGDYLIGGPFGRPLEPEEMRPFVGGR